MTPDAPSPNRRQFLKHSAAAGIGVAALSHIPAVHAAGNDVLKIGLIGCGGRGTGAAAQALSADENCQLTALGDMFQDRLDSSLENLKKQEDVAKKIDVPPERRFVGWDAYKHVLESGVDVVLLATPPHFRPLHLEAAVKANKHIFAEKPVAVDAPGVRRVLAACEEAKQKKLSVVSGLCLRYGYNFQETVQRLHDGAIGELTTVYANDYRGPIWLKERQPDWTDMHYQMRNWYYYTWLSGDFNVEQHVHYLDVGAWILGGYPETALGMGGRQVRTGPEYGNIYDHHSVIYEYANGARLISNTRQQANCKNDISSAVYGTKGKAEVSERRMEIKTDTTWKYAGQKNNIYQTEHDELFASIRKGQPINNGEYMSKSTLLAIMGRMATYTGKQVTWEQAFNSTQDLTPARYAWGEAPAVEIAVPGITKLI